MKYYSIIFFLLLTLSLSALGTLRIESIKELPETYTSLKARDADGNWAPALIVKTESGVKTRKMLMLK